MNNDGMIRLAERAKDEGRSVLDGIIRQGAQKILQAALELEVDEHLARLGADADGRKLAVRNGRLPQREVLTGAGPVAVDVPRVRHRDGGAWGSAILPKYLRKTPSVEGLIPLLYLHGVSTGQMHEALEALVGPSARGLSATTVVRLTQCWQGEMEQWRQRDLGDRRHVYWWADGIHFRVRLGGDNLCVLVIVGALEDGTKELVAIDAGYRESKESWLEVLKGLKTRGLSQPPKLAIGDGALGFWGALEEQYGEAVAAQRCWVHKTANVLDKMPKSVQPRAKEMIHEMYLAPSRKKALEAWEDFRKAFAAKYPAAWNCLEKDKERLFTFYDFPAEHWAHLRTTNPIESTFATVRLRTARTKGCGSVVATLAMVFKLAQLAQKHWRKLNGQKLLPKVLQAVRFEDGIEQTKPPANQEIAA
ncbi:MAG: IS256 family transposase [Chthoniobacterales bacterium]|nr:IS256 family transposase [Chthoniobacterales bacterium]